MFNIKATRLPGLDTAQTQHVGRFKIKLMQIKREEELNKIQSR